MRTLIIIPARSGSKGLKNKNVKLLNGKPLMAYTIEAALLFKSQNICECDIMVSTDDQGYAHIAQELGIEVPYLRSEVLSSDTANIADVIKDVLTHYEKKRVKYDTIILLQPTSPLRTGKDILNAYDLFVTDKCTSLVSAIYLNKAMSTIVYEENNMMVRAYQTHANNRQENPYAYVLNGAIYIVDVETFHKECTLFTTKCKLFKMEEHVSVDIDNIDEFKYAEAMLKGRSHHEK